MILDINQFARSVHYAGSRDEKVMPKVKPDTNAAEILAYLAGEQ